MGIRRIMRLMDLVKFIGSDNSWYILPRGIFVTYFGAVWSWPRRALGICRSCLLENPVLSRKICGFFIHVSSDKGYYVSAGTAEKVENVLYLIQRHNTLLNDI